MKLALHMLLRDWRAGELRVLALALTLAVASVTSVGFFADRVSQALVRDAHQLLGADLVVVSDHPWDGKIGNEIQRRGLEKAEAINFMSMAQANGQSQLAGVKAVTPNYPLRGKLRTAPAPNAPDAIAPSGPERGTVWLEERLVAALEAPVGARLRLGAGEFTVAAVLTLEPERSTSFFNIAPRLMMNLADVPSTGLVQTGSRIWYYLYAAGDRGALQQFELSVSSKLERGQRIENLESGRPEVRNSIDRAQRFLGLTALLAAILAGVAVALGTRRFVERHLDGCAVMRCLGATQGRILGLHGMEFLCIGFLASLVGAAIGYGVQDVLARLVQDILRADLPAPGPLPAVQGFLVGLVLLLGFALPPLLQLKNVPAARVIRRESGAPQGGALAAYAAGLAALGGLLVWQAGDVWLGVIVVGGFSIAVLVFFLLSWVAIAFLSRIATQRRFPLKAQFRYGFANLKRHARGNAVQVASLALGLTAVLLLGFTRNDLVDAWRRAAPPDAPNRFLLGVQPDQLGPVRDFFAARGIAVPDLYPMIRGRLVAINGRPVSEADYTEERARRLAEREFNLSFSQDLPSHNVISQGKWLDVKGKEISVEEGIAKTLGWDMGNELTFSVGGERFSARITSLRRLKWDSMKVNFFVIAPPALLQGFATSYISAFRAGPRDQAAMNELTRRFPNLTLVDVGAVLRQAQEVIDQVISAVQLVFLFALAAGLLVLYSALLATEDERRREAALMRVCGASRAQVAASQRAEFLAMGLIAGGLAALGAAAIGQLLARRIFELDLAPNALLLAAGPLAGLALLALNAWISSRKVLDVSPALTLRESS